jgi:4-azaleucine resistance transporter AzlC
MDRPETADARQRFRAGMRTGIGLAAAAFVLAVTFGATTRAEGWGALAPVVCSMLVFSGSAQFALATALAAGGGVVPAVASAALINGRFVPMGVAVTASLKGSRWRRAVEAQAVVDASWVAAHIGDGRFDRERLIGATIMQWPAWVAGTVVGVLVAPPPDLVDRLGLDLVFPAFFLLLLLDEVRAARRAAVAAGIGAATAAGLLWLVPAGIALIGATVGALVGLIRRRPADRPADPADGTRP